MGFHEVRFPGAISFGSSGGVERRTEIVTLVNGYEHRNTPWEQSRRRYEAGLGVRSLDDLAEVLAFFGIDEGTAIVAYPLVQLSRLFSIRGDLEQARGSAEQALSIIDPASDRQIHVAALNQVAIALTSLDPDAAGDAAHRAATAGEGSLDAAEAWTIVGRLAAGGGIAPPEPYAGHAVLRLHLGLRWAAAH